eukprot:7368992-Pyramimonas_sp.AAC.1
MPALVGTGPPSLRLQPPRGSRGPSWGPCGNLAGRYGGALGGAWAVTQRREANHGEQVNTHRMRAKGPEFKRSHVFAIRCWFRYRCSFFFSFCSVVAGVFTWQLPVKRNGCI